MDIFDLFAKITLDSSEYEKGLEQSEEKASGFGSRIASFFGGAAKGIATIGTAAVGAVTAASAAVTGALVSNVGSVAAYGDNIDKMSQKMGLSIEAYQEWDAVMQHSGTSMEAMKASMKTLANAAESGSDAFEALGISQEAIANMSQEQLFEATIAALQNVEDETTRTYLAGKTLGRGATELGALLNTSAEDTQAMRDRVRELGGVMSEDAVKAAAAYQDSLQDMQTAFSGVSRGLIQEFLPSMTTIMDGLTEIFAGDSDAGIAIVTSGIEGMIDKVSGMLPDVAQIGTSIVTSISGAFVANLPQIVEAGISIIGALGGAVIEGIPTVVTAVTGVGNVIIKTVTTYGPELLKKGYELLVSMSSGIVNGLPNALTSFGEIFSSVLGFILSRMPELMEKGAELISNLASGVGNNLPEIIAAFGQVIASILATIVRNLPSILSKGIELIGRLAAGIIQGIPKVIATIPQLFSQFVSGFTRFDWGSLGSDIIEGIKNGILGAAGRIADAAREAASSAFNAAKSFLGIASPSKLFRDQIGKNIALGIGVGFEENMPEDDMLAAQQNAFEKIRDQQEAFDYDWEIGYNVNRINGEGGTGRGAANITINVYPSEGMDERELADMVSERFRDEYNERRAVYA